jgi:6-phosphogluconolactonase (cycloisomerase 2 family)
LYVLTQGDSGTGNNISSFSIDLTSGSLSLINSNAPTCKTSGACGLPLTIVLDPTGATAFVLNQGAISSYTVNSDGSFGSPSDPLVLPATAVGMARDAAGKFLFVLTAAPELLVYSTTPGSTTLTQVSDFVLTRTPTALSVVTVGTPSEELVFVTSNKDLTANHDDNTVSVYGIGSDGSVTEKTGSPYATSTIDPISVQAVNTNPAGQTTGGVFVYVGAAGNAAGALDAFEVCTLITNGSCQQTDVDNATLLPIGLPTTVGQNPVGITVDPTNNFMYVACEGTNQLFGVRINQTTGALSALSPANLPTGSQPVAVAIHSTGEFLYTSNSGSNNISEFVVSVTTGAMSNPSTVNSPVGPSGMTAR